MAPRADRAERTACEPFHKCQVEPSACSVAAASVLDKTWSQPQPPAAKTIQPHAPLHKLMCQRRIIELSGGKHESKRIVTGGAPFAGEDGGGRRAARWSKYLGAGPKSRGRPGRRGVARVLPRQRPAGLDERIGVERRFMTSKRARDLHRRTADTRRGVARRLKGRRNQQTNWQQPQAAKDDETTPVPRPRPPGGVKR